MPDRCHETPAAGHTQCRPKCAGSPLGAGKHVVASWSRAARQRLLSETYAATTQREAAGSLDEGWRYDYLGRLRLDLVAFRHVVIPDSHLFDGMFFLTTDPAVLLPALTRVAGEQAAPLIIKARASSLSAALRQLLQRDEYLNSFPFNSISDTAASAGLADALRRTPTVALTSRLQDESSLAVDLANFLRHLARAEGFDVEESLDRMESGWSRWLDAARRGSVLVQPWDRPYDLPSATVHSYIDPSEFQYARETLDGVRRLLRGESPYRGDVSSYLRRAAIGTSPNERSELERIERWARRARHWALAQQHDCSLRSEVEKNDPSSGRFTRILDVFTQSSQGPGSTELPEDFVRRLGRLSPADFQRSLDTGALAEWWEDRNRDALRRALDRIVGEAESTKPTTSPQARFIEHLIEVVVEVAATVAGGAVGAVLGNIAGAGVGAAIGAQTCKVVAAYGKAGVKSGQRQRVVRQLVEYLAD